MENIYKSEASDSFMCVPTCINMILERRGYEKIEPSIIACELGLVVPTKLAHKYTFAKVSNNKQD